MKLNRAYWFNLAEKAIVTRLHYLQTYLQRKSSKTGILKVIQRRKDEHFSNGAFMHELESCREFPKEFKRVFYRRYVDDNFVFFIKREHLNLFLNYFNLCHKNIKFTSEKETNNKLSFLDTETSRDKNQVTATGLEPTTT